MSLARRTSPGLVTLLGLLTAAALLPRPSMPPGWGTSSTRHTTTGQGTMTPARGWLLLAPGRGTSRERIWSGNSMAQELAKRLDGALSMSGRGRVTVMPSLHSSPSCLPKKLRSTIQDDLHLNWNRKPTALSLPCLWQQSRLSVYSGRWIWLRRPVPTTSACSSSNGVPRSCQVLSSPPAWGRTSGHHNGRRREWSQSTRTTLGLSPATTGPSPYFLWWAKCWRGLWLKSSANTWVRTISSQIDNWLQTQPLYLRSPPPLQRLAGHLRGGPGHCWSLWQCMAHGACREASHQGHPGWPASATPRLSPGKDSPGGDQQAVIEAFPHSSLGSTGFSAGPNPVEHLHWWPPLAAINSGSICWWLYTLPLLLSPGQSASWTGSSNWWKSGEECDRST